MSRLSKPEVADLISYVIGETTPEEAAHVQQWVVESHDHQQLFDNVQRLVQAVRTRRALSQTDPADVIARAFAAHVAQDKQKLGIANAPSIPRGNSAEQDLMGRGPVLAKRAGRLTEGGLGRRTLRQGVWSSLVAVLLVVAVVSWPMISHTRQHQHPAMVVYTTAEGQRANITLSDGSTVALNVASRLEVPVDYMTGNHVLRLQGEALFTVPHHDGVPFAVVAGRTTAQVLGTRFVIRNYASDTAATVVVQDGRVSVGSAGRSLVLPAGRQIEVSRSGATRVRPASLSQFSFATGVLTLDAMPLPSAIPELNRWYGVDIRLGDPVLSQQEMMGTLPAGSITDLTTLLELTYDVRVVRDGRVLTLYQR